MKLEWKDSTNYQRGQDRIPQAWEAKVNSRRLIIHRLRGMPENQWFVSCYTIDIEDHALKSTDPDGAKREAVAVLRKTVGEWARALEGLE